MEKTEQDAGERFGGGIFSGREGKPEAGMVTPGQEKCGGSAGGEVRMPYRNVPAYYNVSPQAAFSDGTSYSNGYRNGTGLGRAGDDSAAGRNAYAGSREGVRRDTVPENYAVNGQNYGGCGMQNMGQGSCGMQNMGQGNGGMQNMRQGSCGMQNMRQGNGGMQNMRQGSCGSGGRYGYRNAGACGCPGDSRDYRQKGCCPCGYGRCPKDGISHWPMLLVPAVAAMGALFLLFLATIFFMGCMLSQYSTGAKNETAVTGGQEDSDLGRKKEPENLMPIPDASENTPGGENEGYGEYYGEIRDAVRTDLDYSVVWENYEYEGNSDTIMIAVDYPVISGDIPNVELLNDAIAGEIDYFEEYYKEYSKYMMEDEIFAVYSEGYVTYMDENVMSIVFNENIYTDYWVDCGLFCVNIDVSNGVVLDNAAILDMDDEFAVDFRMRSKVQNGEVSALEYLTDQEVAYYLTHGSTGIIFFTPLGMEIGLNYGENYVTVTYKDYKEFLLKY